MDQSMSIEKTCNLEKITTTRARYITGIMNLLGKNRDSIPAPSTIPNSYIEQVVCDMEPIVHQNSPDEMVYTRIMTQLIFSIGKFTSKKQLHPLLKKDAKHESDDDTFDKYELTLKKKMHKHSKRKKRTIHKDRINRKRSKSSKKSNDIDESGDEKPRKKRKHRREKSSLVERDV